MRIVIISYSHHGESIGRECVSLGHEIVGVADQEIKVLEELKEKFNCPAYNDVQKCLDKSKPDIAVVCGKHVLIPTYLQACIDRRISFLVDKPFADSASRLRPVAEAAIEHGIPHALTLPNRGSRLVDKISDMIEKDQLGELILYSSRLNNGSPSRYDSTPSYWLNKPLDSGGGSWIVESSHGVDTFLQFSGTGPVTVVGAALSNLFYEREVEDTAVGMIRSNSGVLGIIESGFNYPSGARAGDHFFRFIGTKSSVFERYSKEGIPLIEIHTNSGVEIITDVSHGERMKRVIREGLDTIKAGKIGTPDIMHAVRILEVQDEVYKFARQGKGRVGPHLLGEPTDG